MASKAMELEACREKPNCGTPVIVGQRRAHRRWHASTVLAARHSGLSDVLLEVDEEDVGESED